MDCNVSNEQKRSQINYCPGKEDLYSEIIHKKKQLIFEVTQSHDFVLPNQKYKYQIYCKNSDETVIENLIIKVINPYGVTIDEPDSLDQIINLGCLKPGESKLLYVASRCAIPGLHNVHFVAYGVETGLFYETLEIDCNYTKTEKNTTHIIGFYDFTPYEDVYRMESKDFSDLVTQLYKKQKMPYEAGKQPFPMLNDYNDESQSFIDQINTLKNQDEFPYQYIAREHYTVSKPESDKDTYEYRLFELTDQNGNNITEDNKPVTEYQYVRTIEEHRGSNFEEILRQINQNSQYFRAKYLRNGTNELLNDFTEIKPDGFLYRFGLLNSEIYHYLGVLPTYTYMSDFLFRWAPTESDLLNLYPAKKAMHWGNTNTAGKKWCGHAYQVWQYYDDPKNNIHTAKKLFTFTDRKIAEEYINKNIKYDINQNPKEYSCYIKNTSDNICDYINCDKEENPKGYSYYIKETFDDVGVFFINIPIDKIPANFYQLDLSEIESIVQRSKPYGAKCLIRYNISKRFNQDMSFNVIPKFIHCLKFDMQLSDKINMFIKTLKYQMVTDEIGCDDNKISIQSMKLIPYGLAYYNGSQWTNKANFILDKPNYKIVDKNQNAFNNTVEVNYDVSKVTDNNRLTTVASLKEILYYNRFNNISFRIDSYLSEMRNAKSVDPENIDIEIGGADYKLWTNALKDPDHHLTIELEKEYNSNDGKFYYHLQDKRQRRANIFRISGISNMFKKTGTEIGIATEDSLGKIHGLSVEYDKYLEEFYIKYVTSYNDNYEIQKDGYENVIGLAFEVIPMVNDNLLILYIEKSKDNNPSLNYFTHVIIPDLKNISLFIRNQTNESILINSWYNLLSYTHDYGLPVIFQTPAFKEYKGIESNNLPKSNNGEPWKNLYRIDKAENSYAYIQNTTNNEISVEDICIHFDNLNIPEKAIVKNINLKTIIESNVIKEVSCNYDTQTNIYQDTLYNTISLSPQSIECYDRFNEDTDFYQEKYNNAENNKNTSEMTFYENKMIENILLDESMDYSLDFLNYYNDFITVKKPFWTQISEFSELAYSFNDIESIEFVIDGFNDGPEVELITQLLYENKMASSNKTNINSGYFHERIQINQDNSFFLDGIKLRYQFNELNNEIKIFDYHINVTLKNKKNIEYKETIESDIIEVKEKKYRNINIVDYDCKSFDFNNGLTIILSFDDLYPGELYKVYSVELEVVYQDTDSSILIQSGKHTTDAILDSKSDNIIGEGYTAIFGREENSYISGLFYNDKPTVLQEDTTVNTINKGAELRDSLYQSFTANSDNITSIEIFPNGFKGTPNSSIKIGLYENHGFTPGKLIKEIYAVGWVKSNTELKYLNSIKYNINIDNLKIGETYWFKIEVVDPIDDNYYLLKNNEKELKGYKLLSKEDNNYINLFSSLKFVIHSIANTASFNHIPTMQKKFINPFIQIGLNRNVGEINKLKVKEKK